MLNWALTFLVIALIAALCGFTDLAVGAAVVAKSIFVVFFLLFLVAAISGAVQNRAHRY